MAQQAPYTGCDLVYNYDWDTKVAKAICLAESNGNTDSINYADGHGQCFGSYSIMQIACIHFLSRGISQDRWLDPELNMQIAYEIYSDQGWNPWGAYTSGAYLSKM